MTREEALDSIKLNVENQNLVKHMLSTEAIMRSLARRFGEDEEEWGLTGLLHDIDVELTEGDMNAHSTAAAGAGLVSIAAARFAVARPAGDARSQAIGRRSI